MQIEISNKLVLRDLSDYLFDEIPERLSFQNPKWIENEKMGRWNGETPRTLYFYDYDDADSLIVPHWFFRPKHGREFLKTFKNKIPVGGKLLSFGTQAEATEKLL